MTATVKPYSLFTNFDIKLFTAGHHTQLYNKFGSHCVDLDGTSGVYFSVYAPAALKVEVIGDFNSWNGSAHTLNVRWDDSGIWEGFIPGLGHGDLYKYRIYSHNDSKVREKADPFARCNEMPPNSASIVWKTDYEWQDAKWSKQVAKKNKLDSPMTVYELHLGSWKKNDEHSSFSYTELADHLVAYVKEMAFTHVEFMPIMEHPYYPSWGYLCTGFFAPTRRYGDPEELMFLIDRFHQEGIAVIVDWVPGHFPEDEHALADFDGTAVYEHPEKSKGFHPDWKSFIFNYERPTIRSFLLSSAHFWAKKYHIDGIRVDAVASMIYLDYSREEGEWTPNEDGSNFYRAAISFLQELNTVMYGDFPHIQMIAEESTAYDGVTRPVHEGGLGFGLKWMMGWMNDGLEFLQLDPIHRKFHLGDMSRSLTYAFTENYILPLSHDEVVHGKSSLVSKMPGDEWQRFANLRLLYMGMYSHPGQKLLFMGAEFGQTSEWEVNESLPWHLLDHKPHIGIQNLIKDLNILYRNERALFRFNYSPDGYEWIDYSDHENSVLAFVRKSFEAQLIVLLNYSPVVRSNYRIGVISDFEYMEIFNSDDQKYWGSGISNTEIIMNENIPYHSKPNSIQVTLPPLAGIILRPVKILNA
jgi:1,4-alpha-glucan branching enzyme